MGAIKNGRKIRAFHKKVKRTFPNRTLADSLVKIENRRQEAIKMCNENALKHIPVCVRIE